MHERKQWFDFLCFYRERKKDNNFLVSKPENDLELWWQGLGGFDQSVPSTELAGFHNLDHITGSYSYSSVLWHKNLLKIMSYPNTKNLLWVSTAHQAKSWTFQQTFIGNHRMSQEKNLLKSILTLVAFICGLICKTGSYIALWSNVFVEYLKVQNSYPLVQMEPVLVKSDRLTLTSIIT